MLVVLFILAAMNSLAPGRDHTELGGAIARVVLDGKPLFAGDETRIRSAAFLIAVAMRESSLKNDAVGDNGHSVCAMQIYDGPRSYLTDADACVRRGVEMIRESFAACRSLPIEERLALYARGKCDSAEGRRLSRDRFALAARIAKVQP